MMVPGFSKVLVLGSFPTGYTLVGVDVSNVVVASCNPLDDVVREMQRSMVRDLVREKLAELSHGARSRGPQQRRKWPVRR